MVKLEGMLARMLDVALVLAGALLAAQFRFDAIEQGALFELFIALSAAFTLALFPAFGIYESWRGRSSLAWRGRWRWHGCWCSCAA